MMPGDPIASGLNGKIARIAAVGVACLAAALWSTTAQAEPYFTVRDGQKCSVCHVNRTGGGKRTDYGNLYLQSRAAMYPGDSWWASAMSTDEDDEDAEPADTTGDYAQGRLNDTFSVGMDIRTRIDVTNGSEVEARPNSGAHGYNYLYTQADLVPDKLMLYLGSEVVDAVEAQEAFALVGGLPLNSYVKLGQFRIPGNYHQIYDEPFVHATGTNVFALLGNGIEYGMEPGPFSVIFSVTNGGDNYHQATSLLASAVTRLGMVGLSQTTVPEDGDIKRTISSAMLGTRLGRITALFEYDTVDLTDDSADATTDKLTQEIGLAEFDFLISRGQNLRLLYEFTDPDTDTDGDIQDNTGLFYEPMIVPYMQVRLGYIDRAGPEGETTANENKWLLEVHLMY